jgi:hypothetical protein
MVFVNFKGQLDQCSCAIGDRLVDQLRGYRCLAVLSGELVNNFNEIWRRIDQGAVQVEQTRTLLMY